MWIIDQLAVEITETERLDTRRVAGTLHTRPRDRRACCPSKRDGHRHALLR